MTTEPITPKASDSLIQTVEVQQMPEPTKKPELTLIPGIPTAAQIEAMYRKLTGKELTEEERLDLCKQMEKWNDAKKAE